MLYVRSSTDLKVCDQFSCSRSWPGMYVLNQSEMAGPTATPQIGASVFASWSTAANRASEFSPAILPWRALSMDFRESDVANAPSELSRRTMQVDRLSAARQYVFCPAIEFGVKP